MTSPLRHSILSDYAEPVAKRKFRDVGGILKPLLYEAKAFDLTVAAPAMVDLAVSVSSRWTPGKLAFLPSEFTWIEFKRPEDGSRVGYLLQRLDDGWCRVIVANEKGSALFGEIALGSVMTGTPDDRPIMRTAEPFTSNKQLYVSIPLHVYASLMIINHPRAIGSRTHLPHAGLARKLAASMGMVGKFPVGATTEITLEVKLSPEEAKSLGETRLTGRKALHWVRSYLRVSTDTVVLEYWRGDPSLGIRQSRYSVIPPRIRSSSRRSAA